MHLTYIPDFLEFLVCLTHPEQLIYIPVFVRVLVSFTLCTYGPNDWFFVFCILSVPNLVLCANLTCYETSKKYFIFALDFSFVFSLLLTVVNIIVNIVTIIADLQWSDCYVVGKKIITSIKYLEESIGFETIPKTISFLNFTYSVLLISLVIFCQPQNSGFNIKKQLTRYHKPWYFRFVFFPSESYASTFEQSWIEILLHGITFHIF